jgi:hypothetical protein
MDTLVWAGLGHTPLRARWSLRGKGTVKPMSVMPTVSSKWNVGFQAQEQIRTVLLTEWKAAIHEATTPFEIGGNFKPDKNSVLIAAVPDTKTGINQTLTVPNPDFVTSHGKYRDRYVVIVIINKY